MKVGFYQFQPVFLDVEANIRKVEKAIKGIKDIDLLVLPELANSGYLFAERSELNLCAEELPNGPYVSMLIDVAQKNDYYIVSGLCEKKSDVFYNSSVLVGPEGHIGTYRKVHLFDREKLFFQQGNGPFNVYSVKGTKIGLLICFDWLFPEATRVLALKGMEVLAHSANLVLPYCQTAMLARAVENRIFAVTANRIGEEKNKDLTLRFTGRSQIVSPTMEVLASASDSTEEIKVVTIDPTKARNKWLNERNNIFSDRMPELYKIITESRIE